jgi:hydrogenase/urease accessory protein HupE
LSRGRILLGMLAGLAPCAAHAHLDNSGLGPIYDGVLHFVLGPEDLVPALAMAVLAGQHGPAVARRMLLALPLAWLAGGLAGFWMSGAPAVPWIPAVSMLSLGVLVAGGRTLPMPILVAIATLVGVAHGALDGLGIAQARREPVALAGIVGAVTVAATLTAAFVATLRAEWLRVAVRVAGSWVAAIGLLLLGWSLRG